MGLVQQENTVEMRHEERKTMGVVGKGRVGKAESCAKGGRVDLRRAL